MPVERKTRPSATPHPTEFSFLSLLWGWTKQGVESFFATQRILLDLVMQQNAHAMLVFCSLDTAKDFGANDGWNHGPNESVDDESVASHG